MINRCRRRAENKSWLRVWHQQAAIDKQQHIVQIIVSYIVYSTHINWSIQCTHAESFVFLISNWQYRLRCSWRCKGRCRSRCRYKMHLLLQILQILVAVAVAYPLGGSSLAATRQLVRLSAHSSALTHESLLTINWHFDWRRLSFKGGVQLQQQQQQ